MAGLYSRIVQLSHSSVYLSHSHLLYLKYVKSKNGDET